MHAIENMTALTLICRPDILIGVYRRACDFAVLLRTGADTILVPAKLSAVRMLRVTSAQVVQCRAQSGQQLSGLWAGAEARIRPRLLERHTGHIAKLPNATSDIAKLQLPIESRCTCSCTTCCDQGSPLPAVTGPPLVYNSQLRSRCCVHHACAASCCQRPAQEQAQLMLPQCEESINARQAYAAT
jgi:hypothetical protein